MRGSARSGRILQRAIAPLPVVAVIVFVFLPLSPAYDLAVFLRAAHAALHGLDVYPAPGSPAVYSGSSFVYPYFAVSPFLPLAALPAGLATAFFFAITVVAVLAACLAARGDPWAALLVLGTSFTITGLQLGALSPLLFVGVVFLWRLRDRPVAFALLAAPVIASKLFLAPLLAWPLLSRRYAAFAGASASTAALLAVSFVLGSLDPASYLHLLSQLGAHETRSGYGLIGALTNAGFARGAAQAAAAALSAALFAVACVRYRHSRDERILFCAGIVSSLLLTPVLWSHYLILLAAPLLALGARRRWFAVLALVSWTIAPPHGVHVDADWVQAVAPSGGWLALAASLAVFGFVARRSRARARQNATD